MKNNQKGFANIVLIGALVVLIGLVSYFAWSKKSNQLSNPQPLTTTTSNSADWKTYTNNKYGFEIQLPSDWQAQEGNTDVSFNSQENLKVFEKAEKENWPEGPANNITFLYYDDITKQAANEGITLKSKILEEYVNLSKYNFFDSKKISFAGQTAFRGKETGMFDTDAIWMQRDNHVYKMWLQSKVGMDAQLSAKILSTFKFTEPVSLVDTSNWKTYTNAKYGFEFKYPGNWEIKSEKGDVIALNVQFGVDIEKSGAIGALHVYKNMEDRSQFNDYLNGFPSRLIAVNGMDVKEIAAPGDGESSSIHYYFEKNGLYYVLMASEAPWVSKTKGAKETARTILSTFKFIK